jgi:hypothetical protein
MRQHDQQTPRKVAMNDEQRDRIEVTLSRLVRPSGTSLKDYGRLQNPNPQGRWSSEAIARAEGQASQAPTYPRIQSGPWGSDFPNPTEEPLGFSVDRIGIGDPNQPSLSSPLATTDEGALPDSPQVERAQPSPNKGTIRRV